MSARPGQAFADNSQTQQILGFGYNPVTAENIGSLSQDQGSRLNGSVGHVTQVGEAQIVQRHGWLPPQQFFVGAMQLTNLVNAKIGLDTAIPSTKPNPGVIPMTPMQRLLGTMSQSNRSIT